jgi:hypothetical protein
LPPAGWVEREIEWSIKDVGAPLLDSLGRGLYSKYEVQREYFANGTDSYADFQRATGRAPVNSVQMWIDRDNRSVLIFDRGIGMDWDDVNIAKKIAVSPKRSRPNEFAGFRGLGIWSGLSACQRLVIITSKVGVPYAYRLSIDCADIVKNLDASMPIDELLTGRFHIQEQQWDADDHFTLVKLVDVQPDYEDLLDVKGAIRYAERHFPVALDPHWAYTAEVEKILAQVPWATTYNLTINGRPVFRRFPPVQAPTADGPELKSPEMHMLRGRDGREVGIAWLCETNRRGQKKAIESNQDYARSLAVRVKNFMIGEREPPLYVNADVTDADNLTWFVGEVFITDTDIQPNTKRTEFQPSRRHDEVIRTLRAFYTSTALRARGWSYQVATEVLAESVASLARDVETRLTEVPAAGPEREAWQAEISRLVGDEYARQRVQLRRNLDDATKVDQPDDAERTRVMRTYLRKVEVRAQIDQAIGLATRVDARLNEVLPAIAASTIAAVVDGIPTRSRRGRGRPAKLAGSPISIETAVQRTAVVGVLPGFEAALTRSEATVMKVELNTVLAAVDAAAAGVLGPNSEQYRDLMERIPDELRRRGINV